ncbi:MAG TPA: nuclear transport factor 2 family protein [Terriglobales bacterium]|jgi:ketosteroid isomerase-like protein|nr:nuclear transport factor 2 family protein [Terriglobales bacterium]
MYRPFGSSVAKPTPFLDVETIIRGLTQDLCTAFNTGNYDQAGVLFAANGQFLSPHQDPVEGPRAIEKALRIYGESGYQDLRLETLRVDVSGDTAIETGRFSIAVGQANGTTAIERGKYVQAWRRVGVWLIVANCCNFNLPLVK